MILYIAAGGALGALARFVVGGWVTTWAGVGFPWGTFAVNVTGSALLGWVLAPMLASLLTPSRRAPADVDGPGAAVQRAGLSPRMRALLGAGFCGGFTTFSTFDFEMLVLLQRGEYAIAATYATASVLLCIAAVAAGLRLRGPAR